MIARKIVAFDDIDRKRGKYEKTVLLKTYNQFKIKVNMTNKAVTDCIEESSDEDIPWYD
ncbi:MAG: hypothetical protein N4A50_01295 [Vallitalea sp.]|nr:hypothetical protein [Vallitalea sp.]